jgi:hypothetical protein
MVEVMGIQATTQDGGITTYFRNLWTFHIHFRCYFYIVFGVDFIIIDCHEGWHSSFSVVLALAKGLHFPLLRACACEIRSSCTKLMFTLPKRHVFLNEPQRTTAYSLPCATIVKSKVMDIVTWHVKDNDLN